MKFPRQPYTATERRLRRWCVAWIVAAVASLGVALVILLAGCQIGPNYLGARVRSVEQAGVGHAAVQTQAAASQPAGPTIGGDIKTPLPVLLPIPIPIP